MPSRLQSADEAIRFRQRQNWRRLWHLFWSLTKPYLFFAPGAKLNFLWVIILILLRSAFVVVFSFLSRDFWTALQHKDVKSFWRLIRLFIVVLMCAMPTLVWCDYARQRLSLHWRRWFTEKIVTDYFAHRNYYHLDQQEAKVDNPDQRISQDVESFTLTSLSFFYRVFQSIIDLLNFSVILFTIYPRLFLVLIIYSTTGTVIAVLIGRRLINLNFQQLQREADFRYALIRVRENAESIAFYRGERREKNETLRRFFSAYFNKVDLIVWTRNLSFFTESYTYFVEILPLAIIAPLYFEGSIEMGVVSQAAQAFRHILSDLSIIVNEFESISAFSAGIDRLGELEQFMYQRFARLNYQRESSSLEQISSSSGLPKNKDEKLNDSSDGSHSNRDSEEDYGFDAEDRRAVDVYGRHYTLEKFLRLQQYSIIDNFNSESDAFEEAEAGYIDPKIRMIVTDDINSCVEVTKLTLKTPDVRKRTLFDNVTFSLTRGEGLLIMGPSGCGKSSLLRAIAGLWTTGHGTIVRPSLRQLFFLPQKPYCTLGTLREQLVYPIPLDSASMITDSDLLDALEAVDLSKLPLRMGGLDSLYDWANVLSLGEQQRLAFARLIVNNPALAILDECSSALDIASEKRLYERLRESGVSFISVGHRHTLLQYHDFVLRFGGDQGSSFSYERIVDLPVEET